MRYAFVYGGIAGAIVISVLVASFMLDLPNHTSSMWFGYLIMLVALSLIFVGVKRYRDLECGGVIRFGRAFALGLGIAAIAGVIYTVGWEIYVALSGTDYMAEYSAKAIAELRSEGASDAVIAAKTQEMARMADLLRNPLFRLPMTFAEIFPVGLLVALVSAAVLRNPRVLPAA